MASDRELLFCDTFSHDSGEVRKRRVVACSMYVYQCIDVYCLRAGAPCRHGEVQPPCGPERGADYSSKSRPTHLAHEC